MFHHYKVFYRGRWVSNIRALDESDAIRQVYMKTGSASKYTGPSLNDYTAKRI